jgi:hypothetical protein
VSGGVPLLIRWLSRVGVIPRAAVAQLDVRHTPQVESVLDAARLAERTYHVLDKLDHEIVLIARMGQNLSQFGLKYSHLGFAVKGLRRGEWAVVHLLNADDGRRSGIYQEGMVNFFSDTPYRFEAAILTLPESLRTTLRQMLLQHGKALHCPRYSLTAYPWDLRVQNSNQWVLEVLANAAIQQATTGDFNATRAHAQEWLQRHHFEPSCLQIGLPTQWAGPLLRDSIRFEDQPEEERRSGRVRTVTVDSVFDWLRGSTSPFVAVRRELQLIEMAL